MGSTGFVARLLKPCAVAAFMIILAACGGGGGGGAGGAGGSEVPAHPPSISNLKYAPANAQQASNGTGTITCVIDFADAGGDVAAFRMTTSGGADLTVPTPQLSGITSGTVTAAFVLSVDKVGNYAFAIWVTDSQGSASNLLTGMFDVLP